MVQRCRKVSPILSTDFEQDGRQKHILVTATTPIEPAQGPTWNCRECGLLIGVTIFVKDQGKWALDFNEPYLRIVGFDGLQPQANWYKAGDCVFALGLSGRYKEQGRLLRR